MASKSKDIVVFEANTVQLNCPRVERQYLNNDNMVEPNGAKAI